MSENEVHLPTPATATASVPLTDDCSTAGAARSEDQALALLKQSELPAQIVEELAKNPVVLKSRKVRLALVCHAHTPRHVSIRLVPQFYAFDLLRVALTPTVPADVKIVAEDTLISRL